MCWILHPVSLLNNFAKPRVRLSGASSALQSVANTDTHLQRPLLQKRRQFSAMFKYGCFQGHFSKMKKRAVEAISMKPDKILIQKDQAEWRNESPTLLAYSIDQSVLTAQVTAPPALSRARHKLCQLKQMPVGSRQTCTLTSLSTERKQRTACLTVHNM